MQNHIPINEEARIEALHSYDVLDTVREEGFDDIVEIATSLTNTKFSYIGFLDKERQWLKSSCRIPTQFFDIPREVSFCSYTVFKEEVIIVEDTLKDDFFKTNAGVTGEPYIRFYCGVPIINKDNLVLGTLCVMDIMPRTISDDEIRHLKSLADLVLNQLELRKNLTYLKSLKEADDIETDKYNHLLARILPKKIALELSETSKVVPKYRESTTILFASFDQPNTSVKDPALEVSNLQQYVNAFDEINDYLKIEKIKTMGEVYMSVCGAPTQDRAHILRQCMSALQLKHYMNKINKKREKLSLNPYQIRIGISSGSVISGVVGKSKFLYDLWGDSVNSSKRILENCEADAIAVSEQVYFKMKEYFTFDEKGLVQIKHMDLIKVYYLQSFKLEYALDETGLIPNELMSKALVNF